MAFTDYVPASDTYLPVAMGGSRKRDREPENMVLEDHHVPEVVTPFPLPQPMSVEEAADAVIEVIRTEGGSPGVTSALFMSSMDFITTSLGHLRHHVVAESGGDIYTVAEGGPAWTMDEDGEHCGEFVEVESWYPLSEQPHSVIATILASSMAAAMSNRTTRRQGLRRQDYYVSIPTATISGSMWKMCGAMDPRCTVCLEAMATHGPIDCGCHCLCYPCANKRLLEKCPNCRKKIHAIVEVT